MGSHEFNWNLTWEWTDDWTWDALAFTLQFERPLSRVSEEELRRLILAWYDVGVWGGYGPSDAGKGVLHFMSDINIENDETNPRAEWWVDMGSAPRTAITALMLCLQNWSQESEAALSKVVFGYP